MPYDIGLGGRFYRLELQKLELQKKDENWECRLDGREMSVQALQVSPDTISILLNGKSFEVRHEAGWREHPPRPTRGVQPGGGVAVFIRGTRYEISVPDPRSWRGRRRADQDEAGPQKLVASMPGKVVRVLAREGDSIAAGQGIAVVEAMKMQNEIRSPRAGVLKKMLAHDGMKVNAGEVLGIVE
jgi:biotin carboxyl carrier protein